METSDQQSSSIELDSLIDSFEGKSWYEIMKNNHDEVSTGYIDIVSEFATLFKESLKSNASSYPNDKSILNLFKIMKTLLPESINSLIARSNEIQSNTDFLQERAQQEKQEEEEDIECNLFSRVFDICTMNNRTISDLFKDIDANHDRHITFEELRMELIKYDPTITIEESQTVFSILDGDGDGKITCLELSKRLKFIKERVDQERVDPLSCIVISKPLDPMLVHGNLSVMLIKGEEFKAGTRCVKIKVEDNMEYITPETTESTHL